MSRFAGTGRGLPARAQPRAGSSESKGSKSDRSATAEGNSRLAVRNLARLAARRNGWRRRGSNEQPADFTSRRSASRLAYGHAWEGGQYVGGAPTGGMNVGSGVPAM
jgi:hypothetical protein